MDQSGRYADEGPASANVFVSLPDDFTHGVDAMSETGGAAIGATSVRQAEQCWKHGANPPEIAQDQQRVRPRL